MKNLLLMAIIGSVVTSLSACTTVPSGMGAIEWTPTSGTLKEPIGEGEHFVSPFSDIYKYDLREQEHQESLDVLANNGLAIILDASILFKPVSSELYLLQTEIGPDYYRILIGPLLRSGARKVVGRYTPEEIYSTKREEVEKEIFAEVNRKLQSRHVQVDGILIRDVHLPAIVQAAIELKLQQEQRALAMQFVLDKERKEAERKKIEAAGIADYQQLIGSGLTNMLLQWKQIDAIEKLVGSPNSKTIVLDVGKGNFPIILDAKNADSASQSNDNGKSH